MTGEIGICSKKIPLRRVGTVCRQNGSGFYSSVRIPDFDILREMRRRTGRSPDTPQNVLAIDAEVRAALTELVDKSDAWYPLSCPT